MWKGKSNGIIISPRITELVCHREADSGGRNQNKIINKIAKKIMNKKHTQIFNGLMSVKIIRETG
jgi:alpha/beta superfamily hydrolase